MAGVEGSGNVSSLGKNPLAPMLCTQYPSIVDFESISKDFITMRNNMPSSTLKKNQFDDPLDTKVYFLKILQRQQQKQKQFEKKPDSSLVSMKTFTSNHDPVDAELNSNDFFPDSFYSSFSHLNDQESSTNESKNYQRYDSNKKLWSSAKLSANNGTSRLSKRIHVTGGGQVVLHRLRR